MEINKGSLQLDYNIRRGELWKEVLAFQNADESVYDFTNHTAVLSIRSTPFADATETYTTGIDSEFSISSNTLEIEVDFTDLEEREYYFDIDVTVGGVTKRWIVGRVRLKGMVVQAFDSARVIHFKTVQPIIRLSI